MNDDYALKSGFDSYDWGTMMTNHYYKTRNIMLGTFFGLQALSLSFSAGAATVHTIDVLGIYSDHVAQRIADPEALFVSNIEYANKALQNSGANYRYNLVHVQQQNWAADATVDANELVTMAQDAEIQTLREQYGADLVAGMVPTGSRYCGIGYVPSANSSTHTFYYWASRYAYSLSGDTCGGRTMTHEMGHNMGLGHSPAQGSNGSVATWGRGWGVSSSFVTVMAYESAYGVNSSAGRVQIHSNPELAVCQGQSCGNPIELQDGANATLALNLAAPQVENWMPSVVVPQNTPPVPVPDNATVDAGDSVIIDVLSNDSDPEGDAITLSAVSVPRNGTAEVATGDTQIVYSPNDGFAGEDAFSYTVMDAKGATAQGSVAVQVNEVLPPESSILLNGGAESGIEPWVGWWGTTVALSADAHTGASSISATGGRGVVAALNAPFQGGREFTVSASLKAGAPGYAYVYLRLTQEGMARYWFISSVSMLSSEWVDFRATRVAGAGSNVQSGELLFYFPYGIFNQVLIDDAVVE